MWQLCPSRTSQPTIPNKWQRPGHGTPEEAEAIEEVEAPTVEQEAVATVEPALGEQDTALPLLLPVVTTITGGVRTRGSAWPP